MGSSRQAVAPHASERAGARVGVRAKTLVPFLKVPVVHLSLPDAAIRYSAAASPMGAGVPK